MLPLRLLLTALRAFLQSRSQLTLENHGHTESHTYCNSCEEECRAKSGDVPARTVDGGRFPLAAALLRARLPVGVRLRTRLRTPRLRTPESQRMEAALACNALNRMFEIGRPASIAVGR